MKGSRLDPTIPQLIPADPLGHNEKRVWPADQGALPRSQGTASWPVRGVNPIRDLAARLPARRRRRLSGDRGDQSASTSRGFPTACRKAGSARSEPAAAPRASHRVESKAFTSRISDWHARRLPCRRSRRPCSGIARLPTRPAAHTADPDHAGTSRYMVRDRVCPADVVSSPTLALECNPGAMDRLGTRLWTEFAP